MKFLGSGSTMRRFRFGETAGILLSKDERTHTMPYLTAHTIKSLREAQKLTQLQLAERLDVSDKTISKWETGRGLPDISLLEPLAACLKVSVAELLSGDVATNRNVSANMARTNFYVCPLCGNVLTGIGEASVSCHGIALPRLEAEGPDETHAVTVEKSDGGYFVQCDHPMTKSHHLSFMALLSSDTLQIKKLYPEQDAHARFAANGPSTLYTFCNRHGLFVQKIRRETVRDPHASVAIPPAGRR